MARLTLVTLSTSYRYQSSSMLEHYATTVSAIRVYLFLFQTWRNSNRQLIGMFSAASNVTGLLVDVDDVTSILHEYGALSFWDYATAAPYVKVDMNPMSKGYFLHFS